MRLRTVALLLALPASGCRSAEPVPSATLGRELLLGSPPPASPEPAVAGAALEALPLDEALRRAREAHPDLRVLAEQEKVAAGAVVQAHTLENPSLQLDLLHLQAISTFGPGWQVELGWNPPRPGVWGAEIARAEALTEAAHRQREERAFLLGQEVALAHAELQACTEEAGFLSQSHAARSAIVALIERRVALGASTELEAGLARLAVAEVERERSELAARRRVAALGLGTAIGADHPVEAAGALPEGQGAVPPLEALLESATDAPAMGQLAARWQAAAEGVERERAARWPAFRIIAGPRFRYDATAQFTRDFNVGVQFTLPVLDRRQGPLAAAEAQADLAREAFTGRARTLRREVELAWSELVARTSDLAWHHEQVVPALGRQSELLARGGEGGRLDVVAVLAAEQQLLTARRREVALRLAVRRGWLLLERARGLPLSDAGRSR